MLFNSLQFLVFFPVTTALYFILPHRFRWALLLAASCLFYMAFVPAYILILLVTILIDYAAGIGIENSDDPPRRRVILIVSIISTCAVLFAFKYFNFFNDNLAAAARFLHWNYPIDTLKILLPIGLSFHTFQSLSYVIEVYYRRQKTERHFGIYALYVMFYPQLVAGPIERPQNLLHQFWEEHRLEYRRATDGLKLMAWGMFKKVVIADRLAVYVNIVYGDPRAHEGISLLLATVFFAFQIYCDFSGYSDIAIGSAQVMGFRLMDNFKRPYFSKSIAEFWKRWHISLSTWFRDYLYIPLGGNRVQPARRHLNLFLTFVVSGFWHGASWTYVFWGALNGFFLVFGLCTKRWREDFARRIGLERLPRLHKILRVGTTFWLICVAWIFFRAHSLSDAFYILTHLFSGVGSFIARVAAEFPHLKQGRGTLSPLLLGQPPVEFVIAVGAIAFLLFVHLIQRHYRIRHMLNDRPFWQRWVLYYSITFGIICFGAFNSASQFIYFQF